MSEITMTVITMKPPQILLEKAMLRPDEAWPLTTLSRSAFYDSVKRGEIPSRRIGRRLLIPSVEFAQWLGFRVSAT